MLTNPYGSTNCIRFEGMISARRGTPLYLLNQVAANIVKKFNDYLQKYFFHFYAWRPASRNDMRRILGHTRVFLRITVKILLILRKFESTWAEKFSAKIWWRTALPS